MSGFLSAQAMTKSGNGRTKYTIEEDRVICAGLEENETVAQIEARLKKANFTRPTLSVQYRVNLLKKNAPLYASLEDFHAKRPIPVEEPEATSAEPADDDADSFELNVVEEDLEFEEVDELDEFEEEFEEVE